MEQGVRAPVRVGHGCRGPGQDGVWEAGALVRVGQGPWSGWGMGVGALVRMGYGRQGPWSGWGRGPGQGGVWV